MNYILKNFGVLLIIIGVVVLAMYMLNPPVGNLLLVIAGLLMVGGIIVHIVLNRIVE
nr:hypothetical protein [uncultured Carboxylicivirga sp.]